MATDAAASVEPTSALLRASIDAAAILRLRDARFELDESDGSFAEQSVLAMRSTRRLQFGSHAYSAPVTSEAASLLEAIGTCTRRELDDKRFTTEVLPEVFTLAVTIADGLPDAEVDLPSLRSTWQHLVESVFAVVYDVVKHGKELDTYQVYVQHFCAAFSRFVLFVTARQGRWAKGGELFRELLELLGNKIGALKDTLEASPLVADETFRRGLDVHGGIWEFAMSEANDGRAEDLFGELYKLRWPAFCSLENK